MSLPDRNNPYDFNPYLEWRRKIDYYADDPFLQRMVAVFAGPEAEEVDREAREFSRKASFRWRDFAERIASPEKRPYLMHYDGHKNRVDRIVRPYEVEVMEREILAERLFSDSTSPWTRFIKFFLLSENSEAGVVCPLTCTWGLVALLEKYADRPETRRILQHAKEGIDGDYALGAQFVSEIQGGSDVPANLVEAVEEKGEWRIYGNKFFCSAAHADYAVVTAKPRGSERVGCFVVPMWLDKERERRNGYTIDRLKWKMGTVELPTAEITFNGALAYPAGPLDRGVAVVVGIVLTLSRLVVGIGGGAGMARGLREGKKYAEFRTAFGLPLKAFPMVAAQMEEYERCTRRTIAGSFKLYGDFIALPGGLAPGLTTPEPLEIKKKRFRVRQLVMLQKITVAQDANDYARKGISIFGGHGVMEDFSIFPRMLRDGLVNELWEGPRNVLLTQMHRDFQRVAEWYPAQEFVADVLRGADAQTVRGLSAEIEELLSVPHLFEMNRRTMDICLRWDDFCSRLFHAYQALALAEAEAASPEEGIPAGERVRG
ncbi:acyl-CoA dehydrogenase family protein [Candidatus Solincola tengchongensis]|uniref:acyl-CoA dehydrogenase family protein n=1 Tax=Candidatus Solincola tengchongensis TaxID=2900693 RepID=UPI00257EBA0D|nr:acyl-CoA dehydrogenase family protein [Candidatus Solincola tengchongensis]